MLLFYQFDMQKHDTRKFGASLFPTGSNFVHEEKSDNYWKHESERSYFGTNIGI